MLSHPFEATLSQPESDASYAQLVTLLSAGDFSDPELPSIVESCFNTFCDSSRSAVRRRWIGITLARMLEKSDGVAHIQRLSVPLKSLGAMIMSQEERGEVKIIAGLIMRQGLEQNIDYHKFWPTEKLANSPPSFPRRFGSGWMRDFHLFLDSFGNPAVRNSNDQSHVGYIASIIISDGFACGDPYNGLSAAVLEAEMLTIIASDIHLDNCHFVDIPVSHIISTRSELSKSHNLQTRPTGCEPRSVILALKSEPWSYCLNSTPRTATEISLMFKHSEDALQWEDCIKRHQKAHEAHHHSSHTSSVDTNPSSVRQEQPLKSPSSRSSHSLAGQSGLQSSSEARRESLPQLRRTRSQTLLQAENTSSSSPARRIETSKGVLTHASRAAKQNALKKLGLVSNNVHGHGQGEGRQQKASKNPKSDNSHVVRTAKNGEDLVPNQEKSKRKDTSKRKADVQPVNDGGRVKKSRTRSNSYTNLTVPASKERNSSRTLTKPGLSALSPRSLLAEELNVSPEPADPNASFKKPTLPAYSAQSPSTPTKPNKKVVRTQRRLQTPRDPRSFYGDIFSQMPSSPPIPCQLDEGLDWSRENPPGSAILSSNSKPVPASPNAESTAISGHADSDDIASEKQTGDSQIAKSDPFSRRPKSGKVTSFLRRLTGEEPADIVSDPWSESSEIVPDGTTGPDTCKSDAIVTDNQPLLRDTFGQKKTRAIKLAETVNVRAQSLPNILDVASVQDLDTNHPTLACTQEIDEADPGIEGDIFNSGLWDDQQHTSESDLPPVYLSSSPPRLGSPVSHSSTSATPLPSSQSALPSSEASTIYWETSLESYRRNSNELFACTSKGAVCHVVDSDSGPSDIAETFVKDDESILQSNLTRDDNDHERVFRDMRAKHKALYEVFECSTEDEGKVVALV